MTRPPLGGSGILCAAASLLLLASPSSALAADEKTAASGQPANSDSGAPVLSLEDAIERGRADQPALTAYELEAQASEQAAIAARSLPELRLIAGVQNFPVTGDDAFSLGDDPMTMYVIGVMREQVRRSKREAEAQRIGAEALVSRSQGNAQGRRIGRDVMIAWIDAVAARAKQKLLGQLIADLRTGHQVMVAGIPTGGSTPSLALQADAEIGLQEVELADARRAEARARAALARWIGSAASLPLPDTIPLIDLPAVAVGGPLPAHPELLVVQAEQQAALRGVDVARAERKGDISWEVTLGLRPKYGQMLSAQVTIPLQRTRRSRQDRLVAEAQARAAAAGLRLEDTRRDLLGRYGVAAADYQGAEAELTRINRDAIPSLESAFKAAEARYAGGAGTLELPFAIVRQYVEATIQSVDIRARRARAAAEMIYVVGETGQ